MKIRAAMLMGTRAKVKAGIVSGTRPDMCAVKVRLQPEDIETGWMPVLTMLVGNGWGIVAKPPQGAQVLVLCQEGDESNGVVIGSIFSVKDQPPSDSIKDGEFWLTHQSGSLLKFTDDGKVALTSNADMNITAGGNLNFNATGNINFAKDINVTGTVKATVDVTAGTVSVKNHVHSGVQTGGGTSGPPVP